MCKVLILRLAAKIPAGNSVSKDADLSYFSCLYRIHIPVQDFYPRTHNGFPNRESAVLERLGVIRTEIACANRGFGRTISIVYHYLILKLADILCPEHVASADEQPKALGQQFRHFIHFCQKIREPADHRYAILRAEGKEFPNIFPGLLGRNDKGGAAEKGRKHFFHKDVERAN